MFFIALNNKHSLLPIWNGKRVLATSEDSLSLPSTTHPFSVLPPCVELLGIESYRHFSVDSFQLPPLHYLRHLIIGNESIHCADSFCVEGLIELKELRIGDNNCRKQLQTMAVCRICNCSKLQSISIGRLSFSSFTHFEMHNLPSLQSLILDDYCFTKCSQLVLTGLRCLPLSP